MADPKHFVDMNTVELVSCARLLNGEAHQFETHADPNVKQVCQMYRSLAARMLDEVQYRLSGREPRTTP